jgi:hypothetical protein
MTCQTRDPCPNSPSRASELGQHLRKGTGAALLLAQRPDLRSDMNSTATSLDLPFFSACRVIALPFWGSEGSALMTDGLLVANFVFSKRDFRFFCSPLGIKRTPRSLDCFSTSNAAFSASDNGGLGALLFGGAQVDPFLNHDGFLRLMMVLPPE